MSVIFLFLILSCIARLHAYTNVRPQGYGRYMKLLRMSADEATSASWNDLDLDQTIVVTGLGVISPCGHTPEVFFDRICNGPSAISTLDRFDPAPYKCKVAAQIRDFDPKQYYQAKKKIKQNDLSCHYAVAASHMALADAGLSDLSVIGNRVGVALGSAFGGMETFEKAVLQLHQQGVSSIDPYTIPMILGNTPAGIVAMETGAKGPNFAVQTACATATHAIGEALRILRQGGADVMIAGGTEAPLTPLSFAGFGNLMAMNTQSNEEPHLASRPFDAQRSGFVMSEGCGVIVMETLRHALQRKASIVYAEVAGFGASCDAYHITSPEPTGDGLYRAIHACLKDAHIDAPEQVQYINAHGTSTKKNDQIETLAIKRVFGEEHAKSKLLVSSIKGITGHSLGAAGGFEAVATILAIAKNIVPPTMNYQQADPECDLNYVPNVALSLSEANPLKVALSSNLGFGGHNGVLAFRKLPQ